MGLVWIIKDSYILSSPRNYIKSKSKHLNELLSCSLCLGFWCGLFLALFIQYPNFTLDKSYIYYPLAVSASCWLLDSLLDALQELTAYIKNKNK